MSQQFIKVKNLQGELVLYHRKGSLGSSITTKEIYFQKPNHSYHILFDDILSIIPYHINQKQTHLQITEDMLVSSAFSHQLYKIQVAEMVVINRKGRFLRQNAEIIIPLSERFLEKFREHSDLTLLNIS